MTPSNPVAAIALALGTVPLDFAWASPHAHAHAHALVDHATAPWLRGARRG